MVEEMREGSMVPPAHLLEMLSGVASVEGALALQASAERQLLEAVVALMGGSTGSPNYFDAGGFGGSFNAAQDLMFSQAGAATSANASVATHTRCCSGPGRGHVHSVVVGAALLVTAPRVGALSPMLLIQIARAVHP